ncbi:cytochrome c oxidase subunit 3 [Marinobacteraceae bacterium S3BR75-40.1]
MPTSEPVPAEQFDDMPQQRRASVLGMWTFLVTELLLFGGAFSAFAIFRVMHPNVFGEAAHHLDLKLGAINTAILLSSGMTMFLAEQAVSAGRRRLALGMLCSTIGLGVVFLGIKGYEWSKEAAHNLAPVLGQPFHFPGDSPGIAELFFNFYYTLTGMHAAHMLVGLIILAVMVVLVWRWRDGYRLDRQTRVVGLYWAFVDVIWIFVFTSLYLLRG